MSNYPRISLNAVVDEITLSAKAQAQLKAQAQVQIGQPRTQSQLRTQAQLNAPAQARADGLRQINIDSKRVGLNPQFGTSVNQLRDEMLRLVAELTRAGKSFSEIKNTLKQIRPFTDLISKRGYDDKSVQASKLNDKQQKIADDSKIKQGAAAVKQSSDRLKSERLVTLEIEKQAAKLRLNETSRNIRRTLSQGGLSSQEESDLRRALARVQYRQKNIGLATDVSQVNNLGQRDLQKSQFFSDVSRSNLELQAKALKNITNEIKEFTSARRAAARANNDIDKSDIDGILRRLNLYKNKIINNKFDASDTNFLNRIVNNGSGENKNLRGDNYTNNLLNSRREQSAMAKEAVILQRNLNAQAKAFDNAALGANAFGNQIGLAARRFSAFLIGSAPLFLIAGAFHRATDEALKYEKGQTRLAQILGRSRAEVRSIGDNALRISGQTGTKATDIQSGTDILAQAGYQDPEQLKKVQPLLARIPLTATFGDIESTLRGIIAINGQFNKTLDDTGTIFDVLNRVAGDYAVEVKDIFEGVQRGGSAFSIAGGDLNSFVKYFTLLKSKTQESSESLGTFFKLISGSSFSPKVEKLLISLGQNPRGLTTISQRIEGLREGFVKKFGPNLQNPEILTEANSVFEQRQGSRIIALLQAIEKDSGKISKSFSESSGSFNSETDKAIGNISQSFARLQRAIDGVISSIADNDVVRKVFSVIAGFGEKFGTIVRLFSSAIPILLGVVAFKGLGVAGQVIRGARNQFFNRERIATAENLFPVVGSEIGGRVIDRNAFARAFVLQTGKSPFTPGAIKDRSLNQSFRSYSRIGKNEFNDETGEFGFNPLYSTHEAFALANLRENQRRSSRPLSNLSMDLSFLTRPRTLFTPSVPIKRFLNRWNAEPSFQKIPSTLYNESQIDNFGSQSILPSASFDPTQIGSAASFDKSRSARRKVIANRILSSRRFAVGTNFAAIGGIVASQLAASQAGESPTGKAVSSAANTFATGASISLMTRSPRLIAIGLIISGLAALASAVKGYTSAINEAKEKLFINETTKKLESSNNKPDVMANELGKAPTISAMKKLLSTVSPVDLVAGEYSSFKKSSHKRLSTAELARKTNEDLDASYNKSKNAILDAVINDIKGTPGQRSSVLGVMMGRDPEITSGKHSSEERKNALTYLLINDNNKDAREALSELEKLFKLASEENLKGVRQELERANSFKSKNITEESVKKYQSALQSLISNAELALNNLTITFDTISQKTQNISNINGETSPIPSTDFNIIKMTGNAERMKTPLLGNATIFDSAAFIEQNANSLIERFNYGIQNQPDFLEKLKSNRDDPTNAGFAGTAIVDASAILPKLDVNKLVESIIKDGPGAFSTSVNVAKDDIVKNAADFGRKLNAQIESSRQSFDKLNRAILDNAANQVENKRNIIAARLDGAFNDLNFRSQFRGGVNPNEKNDILQRNIADIKKDLPDTSKNKQQYLQNSSEINAIQSRGTSGFRPEESLKLGQLTAENGKLLAESAQSMSGLILLQEKYKEALSDAADRLNKLYGSLGDYKNPRDLKILEAGSKVFDDRPKIKDSASYRDKVENAKKGFFGIRFGNSQEIPSESLQKDPQGFYGAAKKAFKDNNVDMAKYAENLPDNNIEVSPGLGITNSQLKFNLTNGESMKNMDDANRAGNPQAPSFSEQYAKIQADAKENNDKLILTNEEYIKSLRDSNAIFIEQSKDLEKRREYQIKLFGEINQGFIENTDSLNAFVADFSTAISTFEKNVHEFANSKTNLNITLEPVKVDVQITSDILRSKFLYDFKREMYTEINTAVQNALQGTLGLPGGDNTNNNDGATE